jgi:hypothetical protein
MQSQHSKKQSKAKSQDLKSLLWGTGSMALKGRVFWIVYRDVAGALIYENSGTADAGEAQRLLAKRALPRALAALAELERIAHAGTKKPAIKTTVKYSEDPVDLGEVMEKLFQILAEERARKAEAKRKAEVMANGEPSQNQIDSGRGKPGGRRKAVSRPTTSNADRRRGGRQ